MKQLTNQASVSKNDVVIYSNKTTINFGDKSDYALLMAKGLVKYNNQPFNSLVLFSKSNQVFDSINVEIFPIPMFIRIYPHWNIVTTNNAVYIRIMNSSIEEINFSKISTINTNNYQINIIYSNKYFQNNLISDRV